MKQTIINSIFLGVIFFDFGTILPWVVGTTDMPIFIQIALIIGHGLFYLFIGNFVFKRYLKDYFNNLMKGWK